MAYRPLIVRLLHVVAPPTCAGCALPGPLLCDGCRTALRPIAGPLCAGCGHPYAVATDRCPECRGRIVDARAAVRYSGPAPRLVSAFKDGGRTDLAAVLADAISEWTPPPAHGVALVPIPLSPGREARRGFNQSALLARALSARWGHRYLEALERTGPERSQRGAGRLARMNHVRGAFRLRDGIELPEKVCAVDDVHTTGATLAAASQALWSGGVRKITARSFARALHRG